MKYLNAEKLGFKQIQDDLSKKKLIPKVKGLVKINANFL